MPNPSWSLLGAGAGAPREVVPDNDTVLVPAGNVGALLGGTAIHAPAGGQEASPVNEQVVAA